MANGISRPLSPHLQIYRPQITSVLSITHRATGIALSVGTLLLVWWLLAAANGPEAFSHVSAFVKSWFGILLLLGWTWSLFFHLCNGIRHLLWDTGWGFEIPRAYATGWTVVVASFVLSILVWVLAVWLGETRHAIAGPLDGVLFAAGLAAVLAASAARRARSGM